jgi:hypothetical protein
MIHCNITLGNIVRYDRQHLAFVDLKCAYLRRSGSNVDVGEEAFASSHSHLGIFDAHVGGASRLFSTGVLPPELFYKLASGPTPLPADEQEAVARYERYWKLVSDDAKDLKLLTPDDVHTITCVIKSITLHMAPPLANTSGIGGADAKAGSAGTHKMMLLNGSSSASAALHGHGPDSEPGMDAAAAATAGWQDTISTALVTISFDDLPHSLTSCDTFEAFCVVWNRILYNSYLWERIKPRTHTSADKAIYVIKCFNDIALAAEHPLAAGKVLGKRTAHPREIKDGRDLSLLPYGLVKASPTLDVWMFGCLIFHMCSGEPMFLSDGRGNLQDVASLAILESWDKKQAEKHVMAKVEDPLAQDLLLQILVLEEDRLPTMELVLNHPFFGPSSSIEAQCILEKFEEQQLMMEETVTVPRSNMTNDTLRRLDNATEKQCKIIFEEEKVVIPTCFIVLPYELQYDVKLRRLTVAKHDSENLELAIKIGKHLLDINNATARLSFWLMMKKNLSENDGGVFKAKLKDWLKRARSEAGELVAQEIVQHIQCGSEYIPICREMLEKSDSVSNARAYIRDPMGAAKEAMKQSTEAIIKCYWPKRQYFYLVDEFSGCPVVSPPSGSGANANANANATANNNKQSGPLDLHMAAANAAAAGGGAGADANPDDDTSYPLQIDANTRLLKKVFLPFMNLTVMAVTANYRLTSMAKLLGLPSSSSKSPPESWKAAEPGLIHSMDQPSSVAEFAVLQDMIKKQNEQAKLVAAERDSVTDTSANTDDTSALSTSSKSALSEMRQLEIFYREYDPMRMFSDLRRVSDGKTSAIWTSSIKVQQIQNDIEVASMESRLRDLRKEYSKKEKLEQEMEALEVKLALMKTKSSSKHHDGGTGTGTIPNHSLHSNISMMSSAKSVASVRSARSSRSKTVSGPSSGDAATVSSRRSFTVPSSNGHGKNPYGGAVHSNSNSTNNHYAHLDDDDGLRSVDLERQMFPSRLASASLPPPGTAVTVASASSVGGGGGGGSGMSHRDRGGARTNNTNMRPNSDRSFESSHTEPPPGTGASASQQGGSASIAGGGSLSRRGTSNRHEISSSDKRRKTRVKKSNKLKFFGGQK